MRSCRLIVDEPADGAWNMAVDDVLLAAAADEGEATLRFYGWAEPTLSLGYFQAYSSREQHSPSRACPVVRRASGGGAIVHDRELTYSLAVPVSLWPPCRHAQLYAIVHDLLCEALAPLGVIGARRFGGQPSRVLCEHPALDGDVCGVTSRSNLPEGERFLCFERRTPHDVILGESKIAGSAQRKRRDAVLHHGGVLLARSEHAPSLPGIRETAGVEVAPDALIEAWRDAMSVRLGWQFEAAAHLPRTLANAERVAREKFSADSWLRRR